MYDIRSRLDLQGNACGEHGCVDPLAD